MKPLNIVLLVTMFVTVHSTPAQTWIQTGAPTNGWSVIACSADGNKFPREQFEPAHVGCYTIRNPNSALERATRIYFLKSFWMDSRARRLAKKQILPDMKS
jgi:hypothetical protein